MDARRRSARAPRTALVAPALLLALAICPRPASGLEPRFDHRDQQGPLAEFLYARDVVWRGSTGSTSSARGSLRAAWGFDPTGDGNELFFGATVTVLEDDRIGDRVRLAFDTRYRACVGTEEFKTILEIGLWGSAVDRIAVGPLVGLGFMYDFSRNFGLFTSAFLAAGIGESRTVSFGGGVGLQFRYE